MFGIVLAYGADQKSVNAYGKKKRISTKNTLLHSLVAANKGADCYIQVYDLTAASDAAADTAADLIAPEFEVLCPSGSFVPFSFPGGWRFWQGCYVRAVATQGGATANIIAGDDVKFTAAFMDGPLS